MPSLTLSATALLQPFSMLDGQPHKSLTCKIRLNLSRSPAWSFSWILRCSVFSFTGPWSIVLLRIKRVRFLLIAAETLSPWYVYSLISTCRFQLLCFVSNISQWIHEPSTACLNSYIFEASMCKVLAHESGGCLAIVNASIFRSSCILLYDWLLGILYSTSTSSRDRVGPY